MSSTTNPAASDPSIKSFKLQHPGSCTGMFWRKDPRPESGGGETQSGNADWPKNGSILNGTIHELDGGVKYLQVSSWKQAKSSEWITECTGIWMPFEQEGLLLHPTSS